MQAPTTNASAEKQSGMSLGSGVSSLAFVGDHVVVGSHVVIGPGAAILSDAQGLTQPASLGDHVEVGANATVMPGCAVGMGARIEPGSVVTRSVPPLAIVAGNPGRITGYVRTASRQQLGTQATESRRKARGVSASKVRGVTLHELGVAVDVRGSLSPGEFERDIPFAAKRYFLVYDVPSSETRGEHAHIACKQFCIAIAGSVHVVADDGQDREEFVLDRPDLGLYLPPMTWGVQYRYQPNSILLVFASEYYDAKDYIRDYHDFTERAAVAKGSHKD